jgi:conjugative transfer ATPase
MGVNLKVTRKDAKALYARPPSLSHWLPWREYLPEEQVFILEDELSVGVMFEVTPVGVEARGDTFLKKVKSDIENLLNTSVPQENPPYILSIYSYDEENLDDLEARHVAHIKKRSKDPRYQAYTDAYMDIMARHLGHISNPDGYFEDNVVTKQPWKGITRRVKCFFYRRLNSLSDVTAGYTPESEINDIYSAIASTLEDAGMKVEKQGSRELYQWLFPWFNGFHGFKTKRELLENFPYPGDENLPFGVDLTSLLFLSQPESFAGPSEGYWKFDETYHKALTVDNLRSVPKVGQVSAELPRGDKFFALLDKMPKDTILVITIVFLPKDLTEGQVTTVKNNSRGDHHEARASLSQAEKALSAIASGNNLFPTVMSLLTKTPTLKDLSRRVVDLQSLMVSGGFMLLKAKEDQLPVNQYIKAMPFNYEYRLDKEERRNRLVFASHLASICPFYGRSRGTKNPGIVFYNRGGEDISLDFILDRFNNAFGTVLGPPGSGKSNWLNLFLWYCIAVHNARVFIFEKGGSFELQGEYAKTKGLTVNQITLKPDSDYAMSPFADAINLARRDYEDARRLETEEELEAKDKEYEAISLDGADGDVIKRDLLGEMELAAKIMITGGEKKEVEALRRSDRRLIRAAIRQAGVKKFDALLANSSLSEQAQIVLPEDVAHELSLLANSEELTPEARNAADQMSASMQLFCDGIAGHFFNRPGKPWEETDITIMEFGILADENYEDLLTLSFITLMNRINYLVERDEHEDRPTIILGDEAHLYLKNTTLAMYIVKVVKMWRKLGAWLWLATQNLDDISNESSKLLRMFEWVIALTPPKGEIEALAKIRDLTEEEQHMLRSTRKEPGKYTEGVLLSDQITALFRSVPPPEIFALGMTEKHEKNARLKLMRQHHIDAYQAALMVAEEMAQCRK